MQAIAFGKYIKKLREDRGLTIRQLEFYSNVSNSYLSLVENGKRGIPSPEILKKLAPVLKVPYEDLMAAAGHLNLNKNNTNLLNESTESYGKSISPEFNEFSNKVQDFFRTDGNISPEAKEKVIKELDEFFEFKKQQLKQNKPKKK